MTRDDLLPLARAFLAQPNAVHRYTNLLDCAAHVFAEALAQPAEIGAGMSDRFVPLRDMTIGPGTTDKRADPPEPWTCSRCGKSHAGCYGGKDSGYCKTQNCGWAGVSHEFGVLVNNPAPVMPERGERRPIPQSDCQDEHPASDVCPACEERVTEVMRRPGIVYVCPVSDTECVSHCPGTGEANCPLTKPGFGLAGIHHAPDSPLAKCGPSEDRQRLVPRHMPPVESPGQKIINGLQDAVAYANGDTTAARERIVRVNPEDDGA